MIYKIAIHNEKPETNWNNIVSIWMANYSYDNLYIVILHRWNKPLSQYSKTKTKQPKDPNLVPKWQQMNCPLDETLKTSQKSG